MITRLYVLIAIVILFFGCTINKMTKINEDAMTPLTEAAKQADVWSMSTLVKSGADVNEASKEKAYATPLIWVLHSKANDRQVLAAAKFLIENGADINACDATGYTPLHWAVKYRKVEIVKYLINKGAKVGIVDSYGQTALAIAKANNYSDIVGVFAAVRPLKIGIITDVCLLRDTIADNYYFSIEDSINAQKNMSAAMQKIVEQKGYTASIQDIPFTCSFKNENTKFRVAQSEDAPVTLQSTPFLSNKTISLDEQSQQRIINLIKYTARHAKPKPMSISKQDQWLFPVISIDENTKKYLTEFAKQKNVDRVLILAGEGLVVPKTKSIGQGVALAVLTTALTLGRATYTKWNVSALQTIGMLVDIQTGDVLWSNSFIVKGGGFDKYDYYTAGEWYDYLSELPY